MIRLSEKINEDKDQLNILFEALPRYFGAFKYSAKCLPENSTERNERTRILKQNAYDDIMNIRIDLEHRLGLIQLTPKPDPESTDLIEFDLTLNTFTITKLNHESHYLFARESIKKYAEEYDEFVTYIEDIIYLLLDDLDSILDLL